MFNPFRLIKRIIYFVLFVAIVYGVINYKALLRQAEFYFYQKYPKAEIVRVLISEEPAKVEEVPQETRLLIPQIGVNAPIVEVENNEEKTIQEGLEQGVVHYPGTAGPGAVGNFFVVGHSSDYIWKEGDYKDVFALLNKLEPDDEVKIFDQGQEYIYLVTEKAIIPPEEVDVLQPTETPTLSLLTCWPIGTPWKRLIVKASLKME